LASFSTFFMWYGIFYISLSFFHCCSVYVASVIFLTFHLMHTLYTLQISVEFTLKTLKTCPYMFLSHFYDHFQGGPWTVLSQVTKLKSVDICSL
jgi:hypothetical protein